MIQVTVVGSLTRYTEGKTVILLYPEEIKTIQEAKTASGIPEAVQVLVVVNGKRAGVGEFVNDGDCIKFLPPVSGG